MIPPAIAEGIPDKPTIAATRRSTLSAFQLRHVPIIDVGMMTATDVPLATTLSSLKNTAMAGTITTPPPIPSKPASVPVTNPIKTRAIAAKTVRALRPSACNGMNKRMAVMRSMAAKR